MNELNEKAINMCQALIGFKPGVSDEEIDTAISTVTSLPMFAGLDKIELKKSLLAIYNVKVDTYQILEGRDARIPWLKEFRAERRSEWQFWTRYKKYLAEQKHFAPEVISQLDDLTDRILDKLFNPQRNDIVINKKGLVVGQVQSHRGEAGAVAAQVGVFVLGVLLEVADQSEGERAEHAAVPMYVVVPHGVHVEVLEVYRQVVRPLRDRADPGLRLHGDEPRVQHPVQGAVQGGLGHVDLLKHPFGRHRSVPHQEHQHPELERIPDAVVDIREFDRHAGSDDGRVYECFQNGNVSFEGTFRKWKKGKVAGIVPAFRWCSG